MFSGTFHARIYSPIRFLGDPFPLTLFYTHGYEKKGTLMKPQQACYCEEKQTEVVTGETHTGQLKTQLLRQSLPTSPEESILPDNMHFQQCLQHYWNEQPSI